MEQHELDRLDGICAHIEEHGIGDLLPYLTLDELEHIDVRFFQRRKTPAQNFPPLPSWFKEQPENIKKYILHVRNQYLRQVNAVPRSRRSAARIEEIKARYLKEMARIRKEFDKQITRDRLAVPSDLPAFPTAAQLGAMFDAWVLCL